MLHSLLNVIHVFVCLFLVLVVLLQQGRGGGMGAALGGGAAQQVFGGRGAGNLLTRATAICATIFMLTSVSLAYLSSSGDRALKAKVAQEEKRHAEEVAKEHGATIAKPATPTTDAKPTDAPATGAAPAGDATTGGAGNGDK